MFPNIGVDLLYLPRLSTLLRRRGTYLHRFASRILTASELTTFQQKLHGEDISSVVRWLGVRWAAKEAAFKAGGVGRRLQWKEVEVRYLASGQPYLTLPREGITGGLSISHDGEYVVAMAMLPPEKGTMAEWVKGRREEAVAVHG
ncbi:4'-phosphopantetheinyl transferase superfamily [Tricharina praecox]|uniref:4'-phosphopantetheinyl transferase superfamily n=1 Tax=Tricharina praecox TaxID=43433 RepID=UPI00221F09A8|nr:4'-phosphopantetheinyl transferase superfamily [Tricharina praecox]KAI5845540.1 4'-phosphopantetheinyl transferase superfamily [Tricharina praecox]